MCVETLGKGDDPDSVCAFLLKGGRAELLWSVGGANADDRTLSVLVLIAAQPQ